MSAAAEAQLVARCREALRQCRADLDDLKAVCSAATSHKAACAQLAAQNKRSGAS
jgi:hypothetical protein